MDVVSEWHVFTILDKLTLVWELGPRKFDFCDIFGGELQHGLF